MDDAPDAGGASGDAAANASDDAGRLTDAQIGGIVGGVVALLAAIAVALVVLCVVRARRADGVVAPNPLFARAASLQRQATMPNGFNPGGAFDCTLCGKAYPSAQDLVIHTNLRHK